MIALNRREKSMLCTQCGKPVGEADRYCISCGHPMHALDRLLRPLNPLKRRIAAFNKNHTTGAKVAIVIGLLYGVLVLAAVIPSVYNDSVSEQRARARLANQSEEQSREQLLRNFQGIAHDIFTCATSTENKPIVSFDNGHHWWADDGRCAATLQKKRDEDAQPWSYWPTTIRVDTDMDTFWLPNEERTCQTYPDETGRVAVVACSAAGSRRDHNIPVKFWGGVERKTVSDWKCRRESDEFVCRAID